MISKDLRIIILLSITAAFLVPTIGVIHPVVACCSQEADQVAQFYQAPLMDWCGKGDYGRVNLITNVLKLFYDTDSNHDWYFYHTHFQTVPGKVACTNSDWRTDNTYAKYTVTNQGSDEWLVDYSPTGTQGPQTSITITIGANIGAKQSTTGTFQVSWTYTVPDQTIYDGSDYSVGRAKWTNDINEQGNVPVSVGTYQSEPGFTVETVENGISHVSSTSDSSSPCNDCSIRVDWGKPGWCGWLCGSWVYTWMTGTLYFDAFQYGQSPSSPTLNNIPNQVTNEGQQVSVQAYANDPDGDPLTFSLLQAPTGASITTGGLFTWTPGQATEGTYWVLVQVSDGYGGTANQWFSVTVNEADYAQFISWIPPPATMFPGQTANVAVTVLNTGSSTWNPDPAANPFRLGSQNPQDNTYWGNLVSIPQVGITASRIKLSSAVAPGQQYTFSFMVTAPSTAGTYNFQWRMVQELIEWFGDYTPNYVVTVTPDISQFVSWTPPPATMTPGQMANVAVTMKNIGSSTWYPPPATYPYRLGSQNPQDNLNWGINRVDLTQSVAPGSLYTFNFVVKAPSTPGTYNFQWRMVEELIHWFGDFTPNYVVTVPGFSVSSCGSISMTTGGSTGSCSVSLSSVGGWSGTVGLSITPGASGGPTASLSATSVFVPAGGTGSASVNLVSGSTNGYFYFTVTGTSGSIVGSTTFSVYQYTPCSCGGGGSIAYGSLITMADGTQVPVQNLKVGDEMLGYNTATGTFTVSTVDSIKIVSTSNMLVIHTADGTPFRVDANPHQTLWVKTSAGSIGWVPVTQIQLGDDLFTTTGWTPVTTIEFAPAGTHVMFDITASMPYFADGYLDPIVKL